jgi:hypothetical protein
MSSLYGEIVAQPQGGPSFRHQEKDSTRPQQHPAIAKILQKVPQVGYLLRNGVKNQLKSGGRPEFPQPLAQAMNMISLRDRTCQTGIELRTAMNG